MEASEKAVAVIIDVSRSREHADRAALQRELTEAFARVDGIVAAEQPIEPTIGDEFQAVYRDLNAAVRATLVARLVLRDGIDCRFGLGEGELWTIGRSRVGAVQDGSAWWSARSAIDEARRREYSKLPFVRTWFASATGSTQHADVINAYLLSRDHILGGMNQRARTLLLGQLLGRTQADLASDENITQSAVSQNLHKSGAMALLAGAQLLAGDRS